MPRPIQPSTSTFRDLIHGGYLYVDKTPLLYELLGHFKGIYFLARPRRFGKSLLISTLDEIFQGNQELFQGLALAQSDYDWQPHPVIRLDFGQERIHTAAALEETITTFLDEIAQHYQITLDPDPYQRRFRRLIQQLAGLEQFAQQKVVILVDEYDKPLLDNIENLAEARRIRELLKGFYGVIKALDRYVRFVFITGISKFSRVGIFSDMNNLEDLTMHPQFATLLGITESELQLNFAEHMAEFAVQEGITPTELLAKLRHWYNGFRFTARDVQVYNTQSILLAFQQRRFSNFWFETGTPTFLLKLIAERHYDIRQLDDLTVGELGFSVYEIDNLAIVPLLFQTGYLTITDYNKERQLYQLYYPNYEVENSFLVYLLQALSTTPHELSEGYLWKMIDALAVQDLAQFFAILALIFANIPYDIHVKQEKYYQSIFVLIFKLIGLRIDAEVRTNAGRIDAVIELPTHTFLFEFKLDQSADAALKQIKENEYYQKYRLLAKPLTLIGVNFDSSQGKITEWRNEPDKS